MAEGSFANDGDAVVEKESIANRNVVVEKGICNHNKQCLYMFILYSPPTKAEVRTWQT